MPGVGVAILDLAERGGGSGPPPPDNWILNGGVWADSGVWIDTDVWED